jgi:hypothetical protein
MPWYFAQEGYMMKKFLSMILAAAMLLTLFQQHQKRCRGSGWFRQFASGFRQK